MRLLQCASFMCAEYHATGILWRMDTTYAGGDSRPSTSRFANVPDLDRHRPVAIWLLACCGLVFSMVVLGGLTRLT